MVAAGGSASCFCADGNPGGDLTGFIRKSCNANDFTPSDTNQTHGYKFGVGEDGKYCTQQTSTPYTGAGGGYYGGLTRYPSSTRDANAYYAASSSGSSYISGYPGCNSISKEGKHSGSPIHYSSRYFLQPEMKNGKSEFPSFIDSTPVIGHEGNGAIRITLITKYTQTGTKRIRLSLTFFLLCIGK